MEERFRCVKGIAVLVRSSSSVIVVDSFVVGVTAGDGEDTEGVSMVLSTDSSSGGITVADVGGDSVSGDEEGRPDGARFERDERGST